MCRRITTKSHSARPRSSVAGSAVTVLAYGTMVHVALRAVEDSGIDAEVIDLRSLVPLDIETILSLRQKNPALRDRP